MSSCSERSSLLYDQEAQLRGNYDEGYESLRRDGYWYESLDKRYGSHGWENEDEVEIEVEDGIEGVYGDGIGDVYGEREVLVNGNGGRRRRMWMVVLAAGLGILLSAADHTIILASHTKIGSDLNALNHTSLIATVYILTHTIFQPLYPKLSAIFGLKPMLILAYFVFALSCLFCCLSMNIEELVASRALAGIGSAGMTTLISILFNEVVTTKYRGTWQVCMNIVWSLGAVMSAPLGGIIADTIGWRWIFLGQLPPVLVASLILYIVLDLPSSTDTKTEPSFSTKHHRLNTTGPLSLLLALSFLLFALDQGSNTSWTSPSTLISLVLSLAIPLFYSIHAVRASRDSFLADITSRVPFIPSYLVTFLATASSVGTLFHIPLYLQLIFSISPTTLALLLIPITLCSVAGSLVAGNIAQRTGQYYLLMMISLTMSIGGAMLVFMSSKNNTMGTSKLGVLVGVGIEALAGGCIITTFLLSLLSTNPTSTLETHQTTTSHIHLSRSLGSIFSIAVFSSVFQTRLRSTGILLGSRQSLKFFQTLEPEMKEVVKEEYRKAMITGFGVSVGLAVCALLVGIGIGMRERRVRR